MQQSEPSINNYNKAVDPISYKFIHLLKIYLFQSQRKKTSICWFTSQMVTTKTGDQSFTQGFHMSGGHPNPWAACHCSSQATSRELGQNWRSWETNLHFYGMLGSPTLLYLLQHNANTNPLLDYYCGPEG